MMPLRWPLLALTCLALPLFAEENSLSPTVRVIHAPLLAEDALSGWGMLDYQRVDFKERALLASGGGSYMGSGNKGIASGSLSDGSSNTGSWMLSLNRRDKSVTERKEWDLALPVFYSGFQQYGARSLEQASALELYQSRGTDLTDRQSLWLTPRLNSTWYRGQLQWGAQLGADLSYYREVGLQETHELWAPWSGTRTARDRWYEETKAESSAMGQAHASLGYGRRVETRYAWCTIELMQELAGMGSLQRPATPEEAQALSATFAQLQQGMGWDARARAEAEAQRLWEQLEAAGLVRGGDAPALLRVASVRNAGSGLARLRGQELRLQGGGGAGARAMEARYLTVTRNTSLPDVQSSQPQSYSHAPAADLFWDASLTGTFSRPLSKAWQFDAEAAVLASRPSSGYTYGLNYLAESRTELELKQTLRTDLGWQPHGRFYATGFLKLSHRYQTHKTFQLPTTQASDYREVELWDQQAGIQLSYAMTFSTTVSLNGAVNNMQTYQRDVWPLSAAGAEVAAYDKGLAGAPKEQGNSSLSLNVAYRFY